ncbi:MAG TPA: glycosyltransferase, partial [Solirubrobacterales bacterium]
SFPEFVLGFVESRRIAVVHIMNSRLGFDLLPDMACLPEPPAVVVQMHAEEPNRAGYVRYATRRYGNLIDAFSVTSEDLKQRVAGYDIPPSRIDVIHSGVDAAEEFDPDRVEPLPLGDPGVPRVLWPGRLVEQKDPMLTLEVLARARPRGAEFLLDVVGDGHMKADLEARASSLGVAEMIRWHPASQQMPRWYRSSDLLLMTSLYEGVPYVIYESLAMGVPVVAPALPGNVELMDDDSGALIEPRDDADAYAEALVALLEDSERRAEMGRASRQRMLTEFSLAQMGRRHGELYERLLERRPASGRWRIAERSEEWPESPARAEEAAAPQPSVELRRNPVPERSIGVGVPCFGHGIFLGECVESIKAQTLPPARIVVVDDGSDDPETIEALKRWDDDPAVTVLRQGANLGPSAARNRALEHFDTSYALWLDADDMLLPDALERMVAKLESAPEDVGFVYPHPKHIGNRTDFALMPAYNLWLLMRENYCPSPALFDRRLFDLEDIAYPEDMVVGHEDWDLILRLAEHGVRGVHADGPTFLYRKQGFSRISAADYGPYDFHRTAEERHPALYLNADAIKAEWAPALSIVPLPEPGAEWDGPALAGLDRQTCRDFELLPPGAEPQESLDETRGRFVLLMTPRMAPMLERPSFVEQLLRAFFARHGIAAVVLGEAPAVSRHAFSQLDDEERLEAQPVGVAFERSIAGRIPEVEPAPGHSLLAATTIGLQAHGLVQWRLARVADAPGGGAAVPGADKRLDLNHRYPADRAEETARKLAAAQAPRLPALTPGAVRRWAGAPGWMPPGTQPLCRHVQVNGPLRVVTNERKPPPGYELEFELGAVQITAQPGTKRVIRRAGRYELSEDQEEPREGHPLGYVEELPLPLLDRLELRRMPDGQEVLVAGADDPLFALAEPVAELGWIEPFPILPRGEFVHVGPWGAVLLLREADARRGRHRYRAAAPKERAGGLALGSMLEVPGPGTVSLYVRADGRLASELGGPGAASRDPRKLARWVAAPVRRPEAETWSPRNRALHLVRHWRDRHHDEAGRTELGRLQRDPALGSRPLFSTTHPVTGDQLVTSDPDRARALGYLPDVLLGYILDAGAEESSAAPPSVPW